MANMTCARFLCTTGIFFLASAAAFADALLKSGDTLVFMGDSITQYGKERSHGYPNLVVKGLAANGINVAWHGVGICGNTSADMVRRFDADALAKRPTVVTISAGVNDVWFGKVSYEQFCANMQEMVRKTKAAGATPVLLSPTTAMGEADNPAIRRFAAAVKKLAADEKVPYAPVFERMRDWIDDPDTPVLSKMNGVADLRATYDGVHMTPAGDRLIARSTLMGLGLTLEQLSRAEQAWNDDQTLIPLTAKGETVAFHGVDRSQTVGFREYDRILLLARARKEPVSDLVKSGVWREIRKKEDGAFDPTAKVNDILVGSTTATLDVTIDKIGATASACEVFLRYGAKGAKAKPVLIAVGENGTFTALLKGLKPETTYAFELTLRNNPECNRPTQTVLKATFTTKPRSSALEPSGDDDTARLQQALTAAAASKGTVALGEGVFEISAELVVAGGAKLVGQGPKKTILRQRAGQRVVRLKEGARLENLAVTEGKTTANWHHGAGVLVEDGAVVNCAAYRNICTGRNCFGAGIYVEKGSVESCEIHGNKSVWGKRSDHNLGGKPGFVAKNNRVEES